MAVEVGGIYFSAELDDKKLNQSIKQIESNIRLMSGSVTTNVNKSTESFKALTKTISYSQDTIIGLTNRVERLQSALNKSKIGTEGFDRLNKALTDTKKKIEEVTTGIPGINPPLQKTNSLIKSIGQSVASIGLTALASSVVATTAKFEKYEAVLTNTYQSSEQSKKSFAFIKEFTASTPFSVDELTSSFIKFLNRGLEPTKESLTAFGDIAASQGKSFDQFTEAVLDATSGGGFERLKEFGIQASQAGDKVSLSFKNQTVVVDKNNKAIEQALINFGKMPGVADSMASVSKTTEGAFSNLGDAMDSLKVALGTVFLPLVKSITTGLASIVSYVTKFIENLSPLGTGILKVTGIMTALVVGIQGVTAAMTLLGVSSTATGAVMLAAFNPVSLVVAGIAASFYAVIKAMEEAKKSSDETAVTFASMGALFSKDGIKNAKEFSTELSLLSARADQIGDISVAFSELNPKMDNVRRLAKSLNIDVKNFVNTTGNTFSINKEVLNGFIANLQKAQQKVKETQKTPITAPKIDKDKSKKDIAETFDAFIERAKDVDEISEAPIKLKIEVDAKTAEQAEKDIVALGGKDIKKKIDYDAKGKANVVTIDFEMDDKKLSQVSEKMKAKLKGATGKLVQEVDVKINKQSYGDLFEKIKSIGESWKALKDNMSNKDWANAVAAGAETAKKGLQAFGNAMVEIMAANSKLAQVKFANLSQNVDFAVNAVINAYDRQQDIIYAGYDTEIQRLQEQKENLLGVERNYELDLAMMRAEFSESAKGENDAAYNAEVEKLQADYEMKLAYLEANTADEEQFAAQKALLQADLDAAKINLRQVFDKKLLEQITANDQVLEDKQAAENAKKDLDNQARIDQETKINKEIKNLEDKKIAEQAAAEERKKDIIKKTELFKWMAGRNAFEMQKQQQMAQVKMQMASIIMSAIQAVAGMTASTLGFGLVPALAIGATLTAMGLSASATSMAAIQSTQYPPPPMFAEGGIVGGNSFTGDKVDAKVNSREMILTTAQQAQLFEMANGKGGGAVNNIYLGGVKVESMKNSNVNEIASRVNDIIRKDIYQAYGGLTS